MFREVSVVEVREVLRLSQMGHGIRQIARLLSLDRKTVRRYLAVAGSAGFEPGGNEISEEMVGAVLAELRPGRSGGHGESWAELESQRRFLEQGLEDGLLLTKIAVLLRRRGVEVPYRTLHRYCVAELGFGKQRRETVRVADGEPGQELQIDFGRLGLVGRPPGRRRMVKGLLLTACYSRHQFCWPTYGESLAEIIEGLEEGWAFFGGVFTVVIPDNTKAIVLEADALQPRLNPAFLEYAQARGFIVDPCRVRSPRDKPRVERAVPYCRNSGFAGEDFADLQRARHGMRRWCLEDAGMRLHGTTQRRPLEHFREAELAHLLPPPDSRYDVPIYAKAIVHRDHHIEVVKALYSVPGDHLREQVDVRADSRLVRISQQGRLLREHPRQPPGGRSTCPEDLPQEKRGYAMRDLEYLKRVAADHGEQIGVYAARLLDSPLPWTRMRQVYRLLGLVRKFGEERVEQACRRTLEMDVVDVTKVVRILERALESERPSTGVQMGLLLRPRFARDPAEFAINKETDHA